MKIFLDKRCIINFYVSFFIFKFGFCTHQSVVGKHRRLLIINSYNESAPWSRTCNSHPAANISPIEDITADVVHVNGRSFVMTHCISGWRMAFSNVSG